MCMESRMSILINFPSQLHGKNCSESELREHRCCQVQPHQNTNHAVGTVCTFHSRSAQKSLRARQTVTSIHQEPMEPHHQLTWLQWGRSWMGCEGPVSSSLPHAYYNARKVSIIQQKNSSWQPDPSVDDQTPQSPWPTNHISTRLAVYVQDCSNYRWHCGVHVLSTEVVA